MRVFVVLCFFALGSLGNTIAQTVHKNWLELNPLEYVDNLPKYITQTKAIAVVIGENRKAEKELAMAFHPTFVRAGIDPVSYYHVDDLFSNILITEELSNEFIKREIKYIIVLRKQQTQYEIVITAFSESDAFIEPGRKAFYMKSSEVDAIKRALYAQAHSLERQNFLVVENAEFPSMDFNIKGQRFEAYKPDLRSETLYVHLFEKAVHDTTLTMEASFLEEFEKHNKEIDRKNTELKSLFANYPFPYEFLDPSQHDEDELKKQNVRYVLKMVHTSNKDCRGILGFKEKNDAVTEYVSVTMKSGQGNIQRINVEQPVYKFYIKHLPSNSFYLGTKWDADLTWQAALQNHLGLLVAEIGN